MGAAAKTCCCKNSAENKSVDLRTDGPDVTKEMKEKSKIINPYFKSLALDSEINQENKDEYIKTGHIRVDSDGESPYNVDEHEQVDTSKKMNNNKSETVESIEIIDKENKLSEKEDEDSIKFKMNAQNEQKGNLIGQLNLEVINEVDSKAQSNIDLNKPTYSNERKDEQTEQTDPTEGTQPHQQHSKKNVNKSPFHNDEELKEAFENAFEEKFNHPTEKSSRRDHDEHEHYNQVKNKSNKKIKKEGNVKFEKSHNDNEEDKHKKSAHNSYIEDNQEVQIDVPSPRGHIRKEKKQYEGSYQKGNWRTLNIKNLIKPSILNSNNPDELMIQGDCIKFANNSFINRYVIVTKTELKFYKSKENFLTFQPPLGKITMFQIESIDKYDFKHAKKSKNACFFKINLLMSDDFNKTKGVDDKTLGISGTRSPHKSKKGNLTAIDVNKLGNDLEEDDIDQLNNSSRNLPEKKGKARKMHLIKDEEKEKTSKMKRNKNEEDSYFIFGVEPESLTEKWIFIIDYFASDSDL